MTKQIVASSSEFDGPLILLPLPADDGPDVLASEARSWVMAGGFAVSGT